MEPGVWPADGRNHFLVVLIDRVGHQVPAQFVGEHQPGVLPGGAGPQTPLRLDRLLMAEQFHHGGGGGEFAALSALGGRQVIPPVPGPHFLQLLADQHRLGGEVHAFPRQPQHLALAQAEANNILLLNFCQKSRCEAALDDGQFAFLSQGYMAVGTQQAQEEYCYPGSLYEGIELFLDLDALSR